MPRTKETNPQDREHDAGSVYDHYNGFRAIIKMTQGRLIAGPTREIRERSEEDLRMMQAASTMEEVARIAEELKKWQQPMR